jgi:hypothetical protein
MAQPAPAIAAAVRREMVRKNFRVSIWCWHLAGYRISLDQRTVMRGRLAATTSTGIRGWLAAIKIRNLDMYVTRMS